MILIDLLYCPKLSALRAAIHQSEGVRLFTEDDRELIFIPRSIYKIKGEPENVRCYGYYYEIDENDDIGEKVQAILVMNNPDTADAMALLEV